MLDSLVFSPMTGRIVMSIVVGLYAIAILFILKNVKKYSCCPKCDFALKQGVCPMCGEVLIPENGNEQKIKCPLIQKELSEETKKWKRYEKINANA